MLVQSAFVLPRQALDLDGPSVPVPPGQTSQLDNPPNSNYIAIPFISVATAVSAILYLIRFYAKFLFKKLTVPDYLTFIAFPLFWVYIYYSYSLAWNGGYLVHQWDLRLKDTTAFNFITFVATLLYVWYIALVKCAILFEWTTIFVPSSRRNAFTWAAWASAFSFSALSIVIFSLDLANCTPFEGNWDLLVPGRVCRFKVPEFVLAISIANFALDLVPLALVQKVIWGLRLPLHKKLGVSFLFLAGLGALGANVVRIYYATRFVFSTDVSYYFSILALTSLAETLAANLVLCIPFIPKAVSGVTKTRTYTYIKGYVTVKADTTARTNQGNSNQSDNYLDSNELRRIQKPRAHWFMSSKLDTTTTINSTTVRDSSQESESQRGLRNAGA
ncbi:hypothetical protein F5Y16DRAFT_166780 [Xylariaceae sp. FL0255]|nr:hypothetical protein F5Y16DRAFT_166780 [Xylariaceae sp. FL0255]